jgi:RimJ/RimL family protein N-acetyltransferase
MMGLREKQITENHKMFVRTERLFLRPVWPEDLDELFQTLDDGASRQGGAGTPLLPTAKDVRQFLERPRDPRLPHFIMYLRSAKGPVLVGGIGCGVGEDGVELGYWIAPRYRGRGFAAEAVRAVLRQARSLGHRRIYAKDFGGIGNTATVLESVGFHDTGRVYSRHVRSRATEVTGHVYVAELERRSSPRIEPIVAAL